MCATREVTRLKTPKDSRIAPLSAGPYPRDLERTMTVRDVMTWNVSVVTPRTTLEEALYLFKTIGIEILVVYDGRLYQGLLTHKSVLRAKDNCSSRVQQWTASDLMETTLEPVSPHDPLWSITEHMRQAGHTYLPVLDDKGRLAGLLTMTAIKARLPRSTQPYHPSTEDLRGKRNSPPECDGRTSS